MQETLNIGEHGRNVNIHEISKNIIKIFSMNILCVIFFRILPSSICVLPTNCDILSAKKTDK